MLHAPFCIRGHFSALMLESLHPYKVEIGEEEAGLVQLCYSTEVVWLFSSNTLSGMINACPM